MNKTDHFCYSCQLGSLNNNFSKPIKNHWGTATDFAHESFKISVANWVAV